MSDKAISKIECEKESGMREIKNQFDINYETMSRLAFYNRYCLNGDDGCDECFRGGVCCLGCKHRTICESRCDNQKYREKLLKMPTEEFAKMVEDLDEKLVSSVAAERIKTAESRLSLFEAVANAAENRVASCRLRPGFPRTRETCLYIDRFRGSCPSLPVCDALAEARGKS